MTNADAIKIAAAIREQADRSQAPATLAALEHVAETIADIYAATNRTPPAAKQSFMIACGL
jgi:hypothetical protein